MILTLSFSTFSTPLLLESNYRRVKQLKDCALWIYTTDPTDKEARELAYMDATLFCIFRWSSLIGAFNVALQVWDMMDCSTIPINNTSNRSCEFYLVDVSNGKVYLIAEETHDSWHAFECNG
ncbi:hypothetical protein ACFXTI_014557 [Malus domestica]